MRLMGILNVTPDSFSDGGLHHALEAAVARGRALVAEGADLLDIGGESTRPGAAPVSPEIERERIVPVIHALRDLGVPISVDTRRASVAAAALEAGATLVNDVSGGGDPDMFPFVARAGCGFVLMHMRGTPATMASHATYADVDAEVWGALEARHADAVAAGIDPTRIWLDPGIGFAKSADQSIVLLRRLTAHTARHRVLIGASRKSFLRHLTGQDVAAERIEGSLAVAIHAADVGVDLLRVHDVAATRRALRVWAALRGSQAGGGGTG